MAQRESRLSRAIMQALRDRGAFVWKNHGGPTMMVGLPDIVGVYKGRMIAVETKTPDGAQPTPMQIHRMAQLRAAGGFVMVARTVTEALGLLADVDATMRPDEPRTATSGRANRPSGTSRTARPRTRPGTGANPAGG